MGKIKVIIAGGTGWAGSELSKAVCASKDLELVSVVSRTHAGKNLSDVLNVGNLKIPVFATAEKALEINSDVFIEYTKPEVAKLNTIAALSKKRNVIVATSGLSEEDIFEIEHAAHINNKAVLIVGNFSLTAVLLQKFAIMAAQHIPDRELIDYASDYKADAPSGTVNELAFRIGEIGESNLNVPIDNVIGPKGIRGSRIHGIQVHSVRLPGHVIGVEAIFGLKGEKLVIKHEAGSGAEPYVQGALLAIRRINTFTGLKRGLDTLMDF